MIRYQPLFESFSYNIPSKEKPGRVIDATYNGAPAMDAWIHKSCLDKWKDCGDPVRQGAHLAVQQTIERIAQKDWNYDLVRVTLTPQGNEWYLVSYIQSPNFNHCYEPTMGNILKVPAQGVMKTLDGQLYDPQILHRRFEYVSPHYTGFDLRDDVNRAYWYSRHNPNRNRMGNSSWWRNFITKEVGEAYQPNKNYRMMMDQGE